MALDTGPGRTACCRHPEVPAAQACAGCGIPFCADCLVPLRGQMLCGGCKHVALSGTFQSYQVTVNTRAGLVPPTQDAPFPTVALNSPCALHEHQEAVGVCDRCGDFLCLLCLTPFEGRSYCLRCFDLLWTRGEIGKGKQRALWHEDPSLALVGAIMTWITCFIPGIALIPALGSITVAIRALRRREPELTSGERTTAISSLVLAVLGLGTAVVLWISMYVH